MDQQVVAPIKDAQPLGRDFGGDRGIRARCDHDHIFTIGQDEDHGRAGWPIRCADRFGLDSRSLQALQQGGTQAVVAHLADHTDTSSHAARGVCLVGSFASAEGVEIAADNGFARLGQTVNILNQIRIEAADHNDLGMFAHRWLMFKQES